MSAERLPDSENEFRSAEHERVSRRTFLKVSAIAGGGFLLSFALPELSGGIAAAEAATAGAFVPNGFIRIDRDGLVTLTMPSVEMGQGTYSALSMLLAEELEVDLSQVTTEHAPPDEKLYANPILGEQMTGGSTSVRAAWEPLRGAGATARRMLVSAAAQTWGVDADSCRAEKGTVVHVPSGRSVTYGALAEKAATLPVPKDVPLKHPKDFKLIGRAAKRIDTPAKIDGTAKFSIDVKVPGMKIATVKACPVFGGRLASVDDSRAKNLPGVHKVVRLDNAVAVVADSTWASMGALGALDIRWDEGAHANFSTADIVKQLEAAAQESGATARSEGDVEEAMARATQRLEAVYEQPLLAHATMEPMNCTVHVRKDGADVWVGTQVPGRARTAVAKVTGLPANRITVHNHLLGGGFGRRLEVDYVVQAAQIAREVDAPVKLIWTREEDTQHDMYRPYYYDRVAAGVDERGMPIAWSHRIVGSSIQPRFFPPTIDLKSMRVARAAIKQHGFGTVLRSVMGLDLDAIDGAAYPAYTFPSMHVEFVRQEPGAVPTAFWRGVGAAHNAFVIESFIDELAAAAKQDPVTYRRALLENAPRARAVLDLAAERAGWGKPLPPGRGRGVSVMRTFGSCIAQVAEVSVAKSGEVRVHRVVCALDCGMIVNPDTVRAQIEGGIVFGLTAALWGEITIKNGRVEQSNFDNYRMLRLHEMPAVDVHLVPSTEAPGGVGEPGTVAIAPAITNAVFAATGKRIRKLPATPERVSSTRV